jgi:hypothetical protein
MKTTMKWENPKRFPELLLYFGIVLVLLGSGIEAIAKNSALTMNGWVVVAIAIFLWVFKENKGKI